MYLKDLPPHGTAVAITSNVLTATMLWYLRWENWGIWYL